MTEKEQRAVTTDALVRKGYFPIELAPPFTTVQLADRLSSIPSLKSCSQKNSRSSTFSIPKSHPTRRLLSVPNPLHQILLCQAVAEHWAGMQTLFERSTISLSTPTVFPNSIRAVSRKADFERWAVERFQRSADARFVLKTDFSRFYHTIYTHSLPWAIHEKANAKANRKADLFGNLLDQRVRNTQDQQTIGLPVGPDTSFILAEIIGAKIDSDLQEALGSLRGIRYVDDFHLYFGTRGDAESGFAALAKVARQYELEVNDRKTQIFEGPDTGEPHWKTAMKAQHVGGRGLAQRSSLISFINRAFDLTKRYPGEGVLAYAVKKAEVIALERASAEVYECFLRATLVHDPSTMPLVTKILHRRQQYDVLVQPDELSNLLAELALFHSRLGHQYEVCWTLWLFGILGMNLPSEVVESVCQMDDPFVALMMLGLEDEGRASDLDKKRWRSSMTPENLYTEYWVLAYEAAHRGWLDAIDGHYLSDDDFFGPLSDLDVCFYERPSDSGVNYVNLPTPSGLY